MSLDTIRVFAVSKLGWIKEQQKKIVGQERETPREYMERESHYVWGRRYLLKVVEREGAPGVELKHNKMVLRIRPGADDGAKRRAVEDWYRAEVKAAAPALIAKWEPLLGVNVARFLVQGWSRSGGAAPQRRAAFVLTPI